MGATHQLQVLGWLFIQVVCQFLVKAGQVLHLHLDPVFTQVVMPFEFIPLVVKRGSGRQEECTEEPSAHAAQHRSPQALSPRLSHNTPNRRPSYTLGLTVEKRRPPLRMIHGHCPTCT